MENTVIWVVLLAALALSVIGMVTGFSGEYDDLVGTPDLATMSEIQGNLTYTMHLSYDDLVIPDANVWHSVLNITKGRVDGLCFIMRDTGEMVNYKVVVDGIEMHSETGYTWAVGNMIGVYAFRIIYGYQIYLLEINGYGYDLGAASINGAGTKLDIQGTDIEVFISKSTDNADTSYVDWAILWAQLGES